MRYVWIGAALAAAPAAALAQAAGWGAFEAPDGSAGVGVQAKDGSQLLIKCDKPGKGEVYAAVFTPTSLVPPAQSFVMRPVRLQFDSGPVKEERWRFYERTAAAVNKTSEQTLPRLLSELVNAKKLDVRLEPGRRPPVAISFPVEGAREAVAAAYSSCKDDSPVN